MRHAQEPPASAGAVPPLLELVATRLAPHLPGLLEQDKAWPTYLPDDVKEVVLRCAARARVLTDGVLAQFSGPDLVTVDLALAGDISVVGLRGLINPRKRGRPTVGFAGRPDAPDDWEALAEAKPRLPPPPSCGRVTTLVVDACFRLDGVLFAHLVGQGLPALRHLSIAACFENHDGPEAVRLLSEAVPTLVSLDVSLCPWMTSAVLRAVQWQQLAWPRLERITARECRALHPDAARDALGSRARWIELVL